jgi:pseudouridine-5'-phosphate glycosidase
MPALPPPAQPHAFLDINPGVAAALAAGAPVVALESTIISHGMPWPQNADTALAVQAEVRTHGAVPATTAVLDGRLVAGLDDDQIARLARAGTATPKASRRDLPVLLAQGRSGTTTVAATMVIAAAAGIRVFATGGIGGVHRGAATSMDISADLQELARTPVAVVCAGAKSILDLGLTLEYLETHGVPVLGYQTDALPAFFCRDSGFAVDARLDDPAAIARVMQAQWAMGQGGLLVTNPIPEAHALPRQAVDAAIAQALEDCAAQGITGKATTPFLLQRVNALTGGRSLAANVQLVLNNARLAAAVAVAHAALLARPRLAG